MKKKYLGIICLLYSSIIIYVWMFDELKNFLSPTMQIYLKISLIPMLIIGISLIINNNIHYHFKSFDLVLILPLIMLLMAQDGKLTLDFANNRMTNFNSKNETKSVFKDSQKDIENKEIEQDNIEEKEEISYDFTNPYFNVNDATYDELGNYITYNPNAIDYVGKTIKLRGFTVKYAPYLSEGYFAIGKYLISCCVADAEFVGFIAKGDFDKIRHNKWYEIEGVLERAQTKDGLDIVAIKVINIKEIDESSEEQYVYPCYAYDDGVCSEVNKYNLNYD